MRTEEEALTLLIDAMTDITGVSPDPELVTLNYHSGGITMGLADPESPEKLVGINLAPEKYWRTLSDDGLWYLVAQEYVAAQHVSFPTAIELEMSTELLTCGSKEERDAVRSDYELNKGVLAIHLQRKLTVDSGALTVLLSRGRSTDGCLEVLNAELEEWKSVKPVERAEARQRFQITRIEYSTALLSGKTSLAESIRAQADVEVGIHNTPPSTT